MMQVSAFKWVPPFAQGLVRDLRVRWALEEAGFGYDDHLLGPEDQASPTYRAWQPFGQVPAFRDDRVEMFESGAIVLYLAQKSDQLMPRDEAGRAMVMTWMFAALNSVEPFVTNLVLIDLFYEGESWTVERRPQVEAALRRRLDDLQTALGERPWFVGGQFSAADILMATVLRNLRHLDILTDYPALSAYLERCTARPAFRRALAEQMAPFKANEPA
ncbi:glutathione S-transferase family protein [Brevundimonas sp. BAL450]|jgi:glutathione S-transferase|uniref:glutathione S-transferase family protein n=1 Tax=Brevundimonas TaxID=41275 RepID=UPI0018CB0452|nr:MULTISPECIES: glutathione S-transferase family protein [Brevundimonas]MBG7614954.1 glutathione S-transferase family protein [Brevundimonas sp. BAL450]